VDGSGVVRCVELELPGALTANVDTLLELELPGALTANVDSLRLQSSTSIPYGSATSSSF
jgi:hypothetical protein